MLVYLNVYKDRTPKTIPSYDNLTYIAKRAQSPEAAEAGRGAARGGQWAAEAAAMLRGPALQLLLLRRAAPGGPAHGRHCHRPQGSASASASGSDSGSGSGSARPQPPEPSLLRFLVCPLSKRPLRYEEATNELINEELGIAYPIVDGIPNMVPEAARMTNKKAPAEGSEQP
ncbi:protein preY, mitochondrial [Acridotheres tristis]